MSILASSIFMVPVISSRLSSPTTVQKAKLPLRDYAHSGMVILPTYIPHASIAIEEIGAYMVKAGICIFVR